MTTRQSYTQIENDIRPRLRNELNHAESPMDVQAAFVRAVRSLLQGVLGESADFYDDDIALLPGASPAWRLTEAVTGLPGFQAALDGSDLAAILERLAEAAVHRQQGMQAAERGRGRIPDHH